MAATLEYVVGEVLELAGNVMLERKKKLLMPSHINIGIRQDEELAKVFASVQISKGSQLPNIAAHIQGNKKKVFNKAVAASQAM